MDETIRIGMPVPLSGTYKVEAAEQVRGAYLAIQTFNESGGLDGRLAELFPRDTKLQVEEAGRVTRDLIAHERVHFVVGALSAPDMPVISQACAETGIIYNAISQSDSILERQNRRPFTFHEGPNPHMTLGAVGRYVFSHFGSRVSMLSVDAEFGHTSVRALLHVGHQIGLEILDNLLHPIGTSDFGQYFERIKKSQPEVLILNNFGLDQLKSVQLATEMGLKASMQVVCPNLSFTQRILGGAEAYQNVIGGTGYYWQLENMYASAKSFNAKHVAAYDGLYPTGYTTFGYNGVLTILMAARQAKSLQTEKVARAILGLKYDFCKGPQFYRSLDHQAIQPVIILESKDTRDMQHANDLFEILEIMEFLGSRAFHISRETE